MTNQRGLVGRTIEATLSGVLFKCLRPTIMANGLELICGVYHLLEDINDE